MNFLRFAPENASFDFLFHVRNSREKDPRSLLQALENPPWCKIQCGMQGLELVTLLERKELPREKHSLPAQTTAGVKGPHSQYLEPLDSRLAAAPVEGKQNFFGEMSEDVEWTSWAIRCNPDNNMHVGRKRIAIGSLLSTNA
jgi:hypothetical protein